MKHNRQMDPRLFWALSLTWGLPLTAIGLVTALILILSGRRPKKWGCCLYFEVGENWGGLEMGPIFLVNREPREELLTHEMGHGLQNIRFGVLMLPLVTIPSAIRYHFRRHRIRSGHPPKTPYSAIWFEAQAERLGDRYWKAEE